MSRGSSDPEKANTLMNKLNSMTTNELKSLSENLNNSDLLYADTDKKIDAAMQLLRLTVPEGKPITPSQGKTSLGLGEGLKNVGEKIGGLFKRSGTSPDKAQTSPRAAVSSSSMPSPATRSPAGIDIAALQRTIRTNVRDNTILTQTLQGIQSGGYEPTNRSKANEVLEGLSKMDPENLQQVCNKLNENRGLLKNTDDRIDAVLNALKTIH